MKIQRYSEIQVSYCGFHPHEIHISHHFWSFDIPLYPITSQNISPWIVGFYQHSISDLFHENQLKCHSDHHFPLFSSMKSACFDVWNPKPWRHGGAALRRPPLRWGPTQRVIERQWLHACAMAAGIKSWGLIAIFKGESCKLTGGIL